MSQIELVETSARVGSPRCQKSIDYATPWALTSLFGIDADVLAPVADDPVTICSPVHALVMQPRDAEKLDLSPGRLAENQIRPAAKIVAALLALGRTPLSLPRRGRPESGRDVPAFRSAQLCPLASPRHPCTRSLRVRDLLPAGPWPRPLGNRVLGPAQVQVGTD